MNEIYKYRREVLRNKQRLCRLFKYLMTNTDDEHPVTTPELVKMFYGEDNKTGRKTIKDDINILIEEDVDIVVQRSSKNTYFVGNRLFELPELKLLIDAVASSRFITKDKSTQLIGKLCSLVSKYQAEYLTRHLYMPENLKPGNEQIYYIIDCFVSAINTGKKVQFQLYDYTPGKIRVLMQNGEMFTCSPYTLVQEQNRYYMIGWCDNTQTIVSFRMDRIYHPEILDSPAHEAPEDYTADRYLNRRFRIFEAEEQEIVLEVDNELMKTIIDHFGEQVQTRRFTESSFRCRVKTEPGRAFYGWVFSYGGQIRIIGPDKVREDYRQMVRKALMGN